MPLVNSGAFPVIFRKFSDFCIFWGWVRLRLKSFSYENISLNLFPSNCLEATSSLRRESDACFREQKRGIWNCLRHYVQPCCIISTTSNFSFSFSPLFRPFLFSYLVSSLMISFFIKELSWRSIAPVAICHIPEGTKKEKEFKRLREAEPLQYFLKALYLVLASSVNGYQPNSSREWQQHLLLPMSRHSVACFASLPGFLPLLPTLRYYFIVSIAKFTLAFR